MFLWGACDWKVRNSHYCPPGEDCWTPEECGDAGECDDARGIEVTFQQAGARVLTGGDDGTNS